MILEAPKQVQRAILILWASWAIGVVITAVSLVGKNGGMIWLFFGLAFWANGWLIHQASMRANWARIVILVLAATAFFGSIALFVPEEDSLWDIAEGVLLGGLELIACYWLFVGEGKRWYSKQTAEA